MLELKNKYEPESNPTINQLFEELFICEIIGKTIFAF